MIYDENPGDQMEYCISALKALTRALEASDDGTELNTTCYMIQLGVRDAFDRLEAQRKAELKRLEEAALHVSLAKDGQEYLSPAEREKLIERVKATMPVA